MDATQLANVLEKRIAFLPGGRDRHGGALVIFPSHGEFVEFSYADVVSVLTYYSLIPEETVRARKFTIIIDMRHAWIRYLKTILKAIQHALYGKVRQAIIVKPEQFLEKQRIIIDLKLEVYEFKISVVSLHKLSRHVDISQLPTLFNGSFPYDHRIWMDLRTRYEGYMRDVTSISKRADGPAMSTLLAADTSTSKSSSSDSLEFPAGPSGLRVITPSTVQTLILTGQKLLEDLKEASAMVESNGTKVTRNADMEAWAQRIETTLHQIRGKEDKVSTMEKEKKQREQTEKVVYDQFVMGVNNVSDWLLGPGEKWLQTLNEIGESTDEAEQLRRDHDQLKIKAGEIEDQTAELRSISDELLALNHPQSAEISRKRDYLDTVTDSFVRRVERQSQVIRMSIRFHSLVDEFTSKLDDLLENLCSEVPANDATSTQSVIDALDLRINAIEKAYDDVIKEGKHFLDFLTSREQDTTREYLPGLVHLRHMLSYLQDRQQRSQELSDVRRLKLQQMLQLFTCENDGTQAIKWLHDLCDTLLTQQGQLGTSPDEAASVRRDHHKLEQTARSTYEYGRQLVHISSVLRRSLRFEMSANFELSQRLEEAWSRFCRGLSERVSRVNLAQAFYHTVRQVSDRLENLCSRVGDEMRTKTASASQPDEAGAFHPDQHRHAALARSRSAAGVLQRYDGARRDVASDVRELRHMGEALITRMEHPVDTKELAHVNHSAIDDIRQHLDQVEKKLCALDSFWAVRLSPSLQREKQEPLEIYRSQVFHSPSNGGTLDAIVREMRLLSSNTTEGTSHR